MGAKGRKKVVAMASDMMGWAADYIKRGDLEEAYCTLRDAADFIEVAEDARTLELYLKLLNEHNTNRPST